MISTNSHERQDEPAWTEVALDNMPAHLLLELFKRDLIIYGPISLRGVQFINYEC